MKRHHRLSIVSLNDAQAHCACDRWSYARTGAATKEEIIEQWRYHLAPYIFQRKDGTDTNPQEAPMHTIATHTPGPWISELDRVTDDLVITKEAFEVCRISSCHDLHTAQQNRGNANLIAAAPELLEALKGIMWQKGYKELWPGSRMTIEQAIAKAEGR